jgi:hypothetical protein
MTITLAEALRERHPRPPLEPPRPRPPREVSKRYVEIACPRCGHTRYLHVVAVRAIERGNRSGECGPGVGCRKAITPFERMRRWWLLEHGVTLEAIVRAGGACEYVLEHGLPPRLHELASMLGTELIVPE